LHTKSSKRHGGAEEAQCSLKVQEEGRDIKGPFGLKDWQMIFRGFWFLRIFSYTILWFTGKRKEIFQRISFLQLGFTGK